jgi:hypothetical protein
MAHLYLIHGLVIALPFACDELEHAPAGVPVDIDVRPGTVSRALESAALHDKDFDASPDQFLYRGGGRSARFLVEQGQAITFEKNRRCEDGLFLHHLLYPVMAAALRQRQLLVLHASSAISSRGAILITGESGAGKSTTVARLVAGGWPLQTDDVSALRLTPNGSIEVMPGTTRIHLHEDAATALALDTKGLARHDWHRMKMAVPVLAAPREPRAVHRIVYLSRALGGNMRIEKVSGRDKLPLLLRSCYGPLLAEQIQTRFDVFSRALDSVEMISIARPLSAWTVDAVIGAIADD